uniref:SHSP domain-containing protein n=1 Tax=Lactuca sativa TaxID=4236 RepID=A0A9R1XST2_LACSA|nr:hypothetical protein LSAT_V11C200059910 [Lactuca sativa]
MLITCLEFVISKFYFLSRKRRLGRIHPKLKLCEKLSILGETSMQMQKNLPRRSNVFDPFSLDIWDPFQGFSSVLNNLPESSRETAAITNARIDWKETPEAHVFKADIPGLKKEEVKVEVEEGRVLQISGERSKEHEEKNDRWHRVERSSGKFLRRFRLPENTKMEEVKATMENGVLTVTVPKAEEKKPEVKSIDIGGRLGELELRLAE